MKAGTSLHIGAYTYARDTAGCGLHLPGPGAHEILGPGGTRHQVLMRNNSNNEEVNVWVNTGASHRLQFTQRSAWYPWRPIQQVRVSLHFQILPTLLSDLPPQL